MAGTTRSSLVYSTGKGTLCRRCGWPVRECRCSVNLDEPVPVRVVTKLRIEKAGRGGKTVTVVDGLPRNPSFLKDLATELKRACGSGGTVGETSVEIQGDHRETLRVLFSRKGWTVKG